MRWADEPWTMLFLLANLILMSPSEHLAYNICPTSSITIVTIEFGVDMVASKITEGTKARPTEDRTRLYRPSCRFVPQEIDRSK